MKKRIILSAIIVLVYGFARTMLSPIAKNVAYMKQMEDSYQSFIIPSSFGYIIDLTGVGLAIIVIAIFIPEIKKLINSLKEEKE